MFCFSEPVRSKLNSRLDCILVGRAQPLLQGRVFPRQRVDNAFTLVDHGQPCSQLFFKLACLEAGALSRQIGLIFSAALCSASMMLSTVLASSTLPAPDFFEENAPASAAIPRPMPVATARPPTTAPPMSAAFLASPAVKSPCTVALA